MTNPGSAAEARNLFGNYEILEEVGRGGMGVVYRAVDLSLDRVVALKLLRDDLRSQSHLVTRFQREAQAVACLDHPNIVQIYSVGAVGDVPYFAMEYLDAVPLSEILKRHGKMAYPDALAIAQQLSAALACAHDAQVIHRDIKPPNILVDARGRAYITDFGIAKVLTAEQQLTLDGSRLGTPQYMAPERCMSGDVNAVSDIYSLGVLLFQMISGRLPYEASGSVELVKKILSEPATRISHFVPDIPPDVERLVAYLIEKKPENRPQTAEEVGEAVARVRSGKPLDDRGDFLASALADFRDTIGPVPDRAVSTPAMSDPTPTTRDRLSQVTTHIGMKWARLSSGWRIGLCILAVLAAAGTAALMSARLATYLDATPLIDPRDAATAAWTSTPAGSTFSDETEGVMLAGIDAPDFTCARAVWLGASASLMVQFEGRPGTPRAGQRMMCGFDLHQKSAAIALAPCLYGRPSQDRTTVALLPVTSPEGGYLTFEAIRDPLGAGELARVRAHAAAGDLPDSGQAVLQWGLEQFSAPSNTGDVAVPAADLSPDGTTLCLAPSPTPDGASYLAEWTMNQGPAAGPSRRLTATRAHISALQYEPGGESIVFLRDLGNGIGQLFRVNADDSGAEPLLIAEGQGLHLANGAFSPDGAQIAVVDEGGREEGHLRLLDAREGSPVADLGLGTACAWHPSGVYLAAIASDSLGRKQIWAIEAQPPHNRVQLTFLDPGTEDYCLVSPDGLRVLAPIADTATAKVVVAELDTVEF